MGEQTLPFLAYNVCCVYFSYSLLTRYVQLLLDIGYFGTGDRLEMLDSKWPRGMFRAVGEGLDNNSLKFRSEATVIQVWKRIKDYCVFAHGDKWKKQITIWTRSKTFSCLRDILPPICLNPSNFSSIRGKRVRSYTSMLITNAECL